MYDSVKRKTILNNISFYFEKNVSLQFFLPVTVFDISVGNFTKYIFNGGFISDLRRYDIWSKNFSKFAFHVWYENRLSFRKKN